MSQCQKNLDYVKQVITSSPILVYPYSDKQCYLFTDRSKHSWSGILMQYHEQVQEDRTIVNIPHPITYQSGTFLDSQKNWSALKKEAYAIYMSFCKIIFYLKDAHVKIRCNHTPLCKFIYSVTKMTSLKIGCKKYMQSHPTWALNISKFPYQRERPYLSRQPFKTEYLGLYEANHPEEPGGEYGKSIFGTESEIVGSVDLSQNSMGMWNQRY